MAAAILLIVLPAATSAAPTTHPYFFFDNVNDIPGYPHWSQASYNSKLIWIDNQATSTATNNYLDGSVGISSASIDAMRCAFAYQRTKNTKYSTLGTWILINMDRQDRSGGATAEANALMEFAIAYDWLQPAMNAANNTIVRNKLAAFADYNYYRLNHHNPPAESRSYVTVADYHGQSYPAVGIAGMVLHDYDTTAKGLNSTPADWIKCAGQYLFVNDSLHTPDYPIIWYEMDFEGNDLQGSYQSYYIYHLIYLAQTYREFYGHNIWDDYPQAKKTLLSNTWDVMPNYYQNDWVTRGETWDYWQRALVPLLSPIEQAYVLNFIDRSKYNGNLPLLTGSRNFDTIDYLQECLFVDDYTGWPRSNPPFTSWLNPKNSEQVLRGSWAEDSDYLMMVTFQRDTQSNRNLAHHDQLSFEYYSKGDVLLADSGENRATGDTHAEDHGVYEINHNTIAIEDPRTPWSVSSGTGSASRGVYKGDAAYGLTTPAIVNIGMITPWMEVLSAEETISKVIGSTSTTSYTLSSNINYERTILYPKDYFLVVDRATSAQPWIYRTVFRPSSMNYYDDGTTFKRVNVSLRLHGSAYNWPALVPYTETYSGVNASDVQWLVRTPYDRDVFAQLYTVPANEITVGKYLGRQGGYDFNTNTHYGPTIEFKQPSSNSMYRVTAIMSNYTSETGMEPSTVAVTGTGNALCVINGAITDIAYTGTGMSSFAGINTNAATFFKRTDSSGIQYTALETTMIQDGGLMVFSSNNPLNYITMKNGDIRVGSGGATMTVRTAVLTTSVYMDGSAYGSWTANATTTTITLPAGEHRVQLYSSGATPTPTPSPTPTPTPTVTPTPTPGLEICTFNLVAGWNLIAVPYVLPDNTITGIFPADVRDDIVNIWSWDAETQNWMYYSPDSSDYFYQYYPAITGLTTGQAYWVEMRAPATITIHGTEPTLSPSSYTRLVSGWNFVGVTGKSPLSAASLYPAAIDVWGWDAETQNWMYYSPDSSDYFYQYYPRITIIQPGYGYWVEMP